MLTPIRHYADSLSSASFGQTAGYRIGSKSFSVSIFGFVLVLIGLILGGPSTAWSKKPESVLGSQDGRVRELLARKHWIKAAELIDAGTSEAQLVRGYALQQAGDAGAALASLDQLEELSAPLRDFAHLQRARLHLELGASDEALNALDAMKTPGLFGATVARVRARSLRENEQLDQAEEAYRTLLDNGGGSEAPNALLGLARTLEMRAKPAEAIAQLKALDVRHPSSSQARLGRQLAERLIVDDSDLASAWKVRSVEERLVRAERLLKRHRNTQAAKAFTALTAKVKTDDHRCRQRYGLGRALRKLRKWKVARGYLEQAVTICARAEHDLAPWARHLAAKAANVRNADDESAAHYRAQLKAHRTHRLADDAVYHLIRHLIDDRGDMAKAETFITRWVPDFPEGDMMSDAVFYVAINAFKRKQYRRAQRVLTLGDSLRPPKHHDGQLGRSQYWRGRIARALGRRGEARKHYRKTMTEYPFSWYAVLAYSRLHDERPKRAKQWLKADLKALGKRPLEFLKTPTTPPEPVWMLASELARLGLSGPAWSVLRRAELKEQGTVWQAAQILDEAGAYPLSHNILRRRLESYRKSSPVGVNRIAWTVAFPQPFTELIKAKSKAAGVPPGLARAIMREESGFNAGIESSANAVGLMQLIVPTAKHMAKGTGMKATRRTLRRPDFNVTLGTKYLAHVRTVANAALPLIPAGYNAGAGRLKQWLKQRGTLPLDLFVELIPYEEARGYTKRVMATFATYHYLYGGQTLPYFGQKTWHQAPKSKTRRVRKKVRRSSRTGSKRSR